MDNMIQFLAKELAGGSAVTKSHLDAAKLLLKSMGL